MKILLISLLFILPLSAYAEYYVIYDKNTKEIYTAAEKDNTIVPKGMEKKALSGDFKNQEFPANPIDCKFINGAFIVNNAKINKRYQEEQEAQGKAEEMKMIEKQMKLEALKELKAKGKKFKHIKEEDFE